MKTMERLYERLTPMERFQVAVAAFGRGDLTEVDRLNDSTPWRQFKIQEPAYFDRLQRITWLSLYFSVRARGLQSTCLAGFAAVLLLSNRAEENGNPDVVDDDPRLDEVCESCAERVSHLKALHSAWGTFCAGVGISASDVEKMTGLPFLGTGGTFELVEEILGEIAPDEDYRQQCLDHMTEFWNTKIHDRWPE